MLMCYSLYTQARIKNDKLKIRFKSDFFSLMNRMLGVVESLQREACDGGGF